MAGQSGRTFPRVAVLMGGASTEREVSLSSGHSCSAALRDAGYEVTEVDAGPDLARVLAELSPDAVFNALHGRWGEDGCVQGLLEWLRIPYTHSGVLASALAMDKARAKEVFAAAGLPVTQSVLATPEEVRARHILPPPYVVKPNAEGSSVGVYIVHEDANGPPQLAADMPQDLMVETYVPGRELTVTVMGDRVLAVTDIPVRRLVRLRRQIPSRRLASYRACGPAGRDHRGLPRHRTPCPPRARLPRHLALGPALGRSARVGGADPP